MLLSVVVREMHDFPDEVRKKQITSVKFAPSDLDLETIINQIRVPQPQKNKAGLLSTAKKKTVPNGTV